MASFSTGSSNHSGDRIQIRVLDTDHVEAPARRRPTFTTAGIEGQRARSYNSALAEARAQRRGLDRRIARLERKAKPLKKSKRASQRLLGGIGELAGSGQKCYRML